MKVAKGLNQAAAIMTIIMGISHIFVPFFLPWDEHLSTLYEPITWALYAMNFFFSILLAWGGLLSLISFSSRQFRKWINGGMAFFWVAGGIYEVVFPFPIVEARLILPIVSFSIAGLYIISLIWQYKIDTKSPSNKQTDNSKVEPR